MSVQDIYLVTRRLQTATREQLLHAEKALGMTFPSGYADFVMNYGEGTYSNFVRVFMPLRIVEEYRTFQERWNEYFLWEEGEDVIPKERVIESVIIADTLQGDELIFHPSQPNRLLVLPRYFETVFEAGENLQEAIEWLCKSGELTKPIDFAYFESNQRRKTLTFEGSGTFLKVCKVLKSLAIHDHTQIETGEEDLFFEMFVADFQGSVVVIGSGSELTVLVTHDEETKSKKLDTAIACLNQLGLAIQNE